MLSMLFLTQGKASTHTCHTKGRQNPHHTQRAARAPTTVPMGRALRARPISIVVFPFVYVVCVCVVCVCVRVCVSVCVCVTVQVCVTVCNCV